MDEFDITCSCGTHVQVSVPASLSAPYDRIWTCPTCGASLHVGPRKRPPRDISQTPMPQYGTSAFREGDYDS